jgi:hypothetical protein
MRDLRRKKHPSGSCPQEMGIAAPSEREAAVRALHDAWTERLVEGLHLCPFARASREQGRSAVHLWEGEVPGAAGDARVEDALAQFFLACLADAKAEVVQVIVPGLSIEPLVWEKVAKAYHALLRPLHPDGGWAVAAFHPQAPFGVSSAAALVPLFRRSPFPTIQWLRLSVLERVREGREDHDRYVAPGTPEFLAILSTPPRPGVARVVAEANERTAYRVGIERIVDEQEALAIAGAMAYPTSEYSSDPFVRAGSVTGSLPREGSDFAVPEEE